MLICFICVIIIEENDQKHELELLDSSSGQFEPSSEQENIVENEGLQWRTIGILLISLGALSSSGTSVFNRALSEVDYSVVMAYYGAISTVISLVLLVGDVLVIGRS